MRYPSAIDTPPTLIDDTTPLSGLFFNYLGSLLEALQLEIGPLGEANTIHGSLARFLGIELANRLSSWRSVAKTYGGNEAGQVYGLIHQQRTHLASDFNNVQQSTVTAHQGKPSSGKIPAVFAEISGIGLTTAQVHGGPSAALRGEVYDTSGATYSYRYRGANIVTANGTCFGTHQQPVSFLLFFMHEAF